MPANKRHEWETFLHLENEEEKRKQIELYIDRGLGACHLRNDKIAKVVQDSLWHRDGTDYRLLAWVVMPNHLHVLVELWDVPLGKLMKSWKSFSARHSNRILGLNGAFWSEDYFDRYIRDDEHFYQVRRYIENNPVKARLARTPEDWCWSSRRYRSEEDFETLTHRPGAGTSTSPVKPIR